MESFLNEWGVGIVGPVIVLCALPLMVGGLLVRRRGRRRADGLALARAARCKIGDVAAGGTVALAGRWRALDGARGILEDPDAPERRVLVERPRDAPPIADGANVLVVGCATTQVDDPRGSSYRGGARIWRVEAHGDEHVVTPEVAALERAAGKARVWSGVGAALFATGLAVALVTCVIAYRAANDGAAAQFEPIE
jgi:hypothetical protein